MARTPSSMVKLGTLAPDFSLPDANGKDYSLAQFRGRPLLVMFLCNHCPFVKHVRSELAKIGKEYAGKKISLVAINSNDFRSYPDDRPELMLKESAEAGYNFPYLVDESQLVAKAYDAACTPDFFLFNGAHELVYRGQLDGSRPGNAVPVTGEDLRAAIESVLRGESPSPKQLPSLGCNIKWKS